MAYEGMNHATISICTDCLVWLANGETPDVEEWGDTGWEAPTDEITLGAMDCELCIDGQETLPPCEEWFSWHPCDACGSTLGGSRHHATVWYESL